MKPNLVLLSLISVCILRLSAQDPEFSQYHSSALWLNPAYAGASGQATASAGFRDQWPKLSASFLTWNAGYDQYFAKLHGGLGLSLNFDNAGNGVLQTSSANLAYSFRIEPVKGKLVVCPAVQVGLVSKFYNFATLDFGDMLDPRRGFVYNADDLQSARVTGLDLGAGVLAYTQRFYAGFSMAHLNEPHVSYSGSSRLPAKLMVQAGATLGQLPGSYENKCSVAPQVAYLRQAQFNQTMAGLTARFAHYLLGASYRFGDAVIAQIGFENKLFRAGYSYDYTVSSLDNKNTGGSHELSLQFHLFGSKKPEGFLAAPVTAF